MTPKIRLAVAGKVPSVSVSFVRGEWVKGKGGKQSAPAMPVPVPRSFVGNSSG
jgi:hypothetical protein